MKQLANLLGLLVFAFILAACGTAGSPSPTSPSQPSSEVPSVGVPSFEPIADGEPTIVIPNPPTQNVHDVAVTNIAAGLDGRRLFVRLAWWSGVEPCNVLDSIAMDSDGTNIRLAVREGAKDLNAACIEIAQFKATIVDLGEMEPGTYTISAVGEADPISVTVP